jgi:cytidylate kinase
MDNYVITIARGFGSGGKQVGLELSRDLGIPCYESQILALASEYSGLSKRWFVKADEKLPLPYSFLPKLKSTPSTDHLLTPQDRKFTSAKNLFNIQIKIIRELAETESCIIVGKCANYFLRDLNNVISVYIEAPRAYCLANIMKKLDATEEEAHRLITETDKYRAAYFKYYTKGRLWTDPVLYDMTLNSERVGVEKCVELIKAYIKIKFAENTLPEQGPLGT